MPSVKIASRWSAQGGSTVALCALCNLFNERGYDCTFYGPHEWHRSHCRSGALQDLSIEKDDRLIAHFIRFKRRPPARLVVLSCHEKHLFPVREVKPVFWDCVQYVSESQKRWQGTEGVVIPNVLPELRASPQRRRHVAGVIGSIDRYKRTHLSIKRALDAGYAVVLVYGRVTDRAYFQTSVKPLLDDGRVRMLGHEDDRQRIYDSVDEVFHSSRSETFNYIKAECGVTGVRYNGLPEADSGAEYWDRQRILEAWLRCLKLA